MAPTFSSARLSLLERGVIFAVAYIRGGGELGEEWREAGRMMQKMNTFHDFIDCAEYLLKSGYTSRRSACIVTGVPPSGEGESIDGGSSSRTKRRESPSRSSACMIDAPSGAVLRSSPCAPSAFEYHSIAAATPFTTICGVMV
jgi:hypothetical protein